MIRLVAINPLQKEVYSNCCNPTKCSWGNQYYKHFVLIKVRLQRLTIQQGLKDPTKTCMDAGVIRSLSRMQV
jgi:hypothetical protein